jgi:hypothetical protein
MPSALPTSASYVVSNIEQGRILDVTDIDGEETVFTQEANHLPLVGPIATSALQDKVEARL